MRRLTLRRFAAVGDLDLDLACAARLPPSAICFLRAVSQETSLPPFRLAGFLRQLPSSCSLLPGTGSYPGQQRDDFAWILVSLFVAMSVSHLIHEMHTPSDHISGRAHRCGISKKPGGEMNNAKVNCGECKYYKGIVIPTGANPEIRVSAVEGPAVHSTSTQLKRKPCCSFEA